MFRCNSSFDNRSAKLFTDPPSPKNTPGDSIVILLQESFFCGEIEKAIQAAASGVAGFEDAEEMFQSGCDIIPFWAFLGSRVGCLQNTRHVDLLPAGLGKRIAKREDL